MKDGVQIIIPQETYDKLSKCASHNQQAVVDEISSAIGKHIEKEEEKVKSLKEGKKLLCEG